MNRRKPHVAGSFYPADSHLLEEWFSASIQPLRPLLRPKAVILPHAGYMYSGKTAAEVMRRVEIPDRCLLIGPNHWGVGHPFALFPEGEWETPLGPVRIDEEFAAGLLESSHDIYADFDAHEREHSLEVEVPFLKFCNPTVKIVPLLVGTLDTEWAAQVALCMLEFLENRSGFLIVISTDMTHYESDTVTRKKDQYALRAIEALNGEQLIRVVETHRITMCGFIPVFMSIILAKGLGAQRATLIHYSTSADASGDKTRVVGYAGFVVE